VPLSSLLENEQGRICLVEGNESLVHRLREMGLREGAQVRMIRPGKPCLIHVNDHRISLRADELITVLVDLGEG
jgi:ferrous iron transport protein A